jgi:hypothetical protein
MGHSSSTARSSRWLQHPRYSKPFSGKAAVSAALALFASLLSMRLYRTQFSSGQDLLRKNYRNAHCSLCPLNRSTTTATAKHNEIALSFSKPLFTHNFRGRA